MQWNGIKVQVVLLALVVGLAAFWGGQWLYNRFNYERPLAGALGENKDVIAYSINDQGPALEIEVKLRQVDNLQQSYSALYQSVQNIVGSRDFKIIIKDERDKTLESLYYHARLAAYEALERGNFLEMADYITRQSAGEGARARLTVDEDRLYIQISHGDSYLYEVLPRTGGDSPLFSGERGNQS